MYYIDVEHIQMEKNMKQLSIVFITFILLSSIVRADPPFIEHKGGFFQEAKLLKTCLSDGEKAFSDLGIEVKKTTNPKNEVVGFNGDFKIVLYCIGEEGGCDEPEDEYASGGTVMVAGPNYKKTASWVNKVIEAMKLQNEL